MKTYTNYKASGVEWLGDIPEAWEVRKLKYALRLKASQTKSSSKENYIGLENIESWSGCLNMNERILPEGISKVFEKGDILFSKLRPYLAKGFIADFSGSCTSELLVFKTTNNNKFVLYLLLSNRLIELIDSSTYGSKMPRANWEYIGNIPINIPPLPEQQTIANYLDKKTAQIARFIENKKKLIQLLEEEKKALITQAVTRGLDKSVRLKPSGVEWLGDIPEHWEVRKLKFISKVNLSNVDKKSVGGQKTTYLCNYVDVYYNKKITSQIEFMKATATEEQILKFKLVQGDVLITKDSESFNDIAVPSYVSESFENVVCGYHLAHIKPKYILGSFLCYSFLCEKMKWQFHISANGITRYGLGKYAIENALFLIPALPEQQAIVAHIEKQSQKIDEVISKYQKEIELIIEYRQRLIYDAVTGKIKLTEDA